MSSPVADSSGRNSASSGCQASWSSEIGDVRHPGRQPVVVSEPVVRHEAQAAPLVRRSEGFLPPRECAGLTQQMIYRVLRAGDRHDLHEVGIVDEVDDGDPEAEPLDDPVDDRLQRGGQVRAAVDPQDQPLQVTQREQAEVPHVVIDLRSAPRNVLRTLS